MATISGNYENNLLRFKYNKNFEDGEIKKPSFLKVIFSKTVKIDVSDENKIKHVTLRQKDVINFLESNQIEVSPYATKSNITTLFCDFVNHSFEKEYVAPKPLCGSYAKGKVKLAVWDNEDSAKGISTASLYQRLFQSTVKIKIFDQGKFRTVVVLKKDFINESKKNGIVIPTESRKQDLAQALKNLTQKLETISEQTKSENRNSNSIFQPKVEENVLEKESLEEDKIPELVLNPVKNAISVTSAEPTYSKDGKSISGSSDEGEYVVLAGLKSPRFALKTYTKPTAIKDPVLIESQGKKMYIDGGELSNRYHLPMAEVLEKAKQGLLDDYLESQEKKLELLEQIITYYDRLFQKHEKSKSKILSSDILMKLVRVAVKNKVKNCDPVIRDKQNKASRLNGQIYLPFFDHNKLHLFQLSGAEALHSGAFGKIFKVANPVTGGKKILKFGISASQIPGFTEEQTAEFALRSLKNEKMVRDNLNNESLEGKFPGIQKKSKGFTLVTSAIPGIIEKIPECGVGVLAESLYDIDLFDFAAISSQTFKSVNEKITAFAKTLEGFYQAVNKGLVHGDINPTNMLIKGQNIDVSDFGGAHLGEKESTKGKIHSCNLSPCIDHEVIRLLQADKSIDQVIELHPEAKDFLQKYRELPLTKILTKLYVSKDIFALGCSFYLFLSETSYPHNLTQYAGDPDQYNPSSTQTYTPMGYVPKNTVFNRKTLENKNVPQEIIDLIDGMVKPNPSDRLDFDQTMNVLKKYIV